MSRCQWTIDAHGQARLIDGGRVVRTIDLTGNAVRPPLPPAPEPVQLQPVTCEIFERDRADLVAAAAIAAAFIAAMTVIVILWLT